MHLDIWRRPRKLNLSEGFFGNPKTSRRDYDTAYKAFLWQLASGCDGRSAHAGNPILRPSHGASHCYSR